ncbi:MAG: universal stress protein [Gemmataceae bacterium]
MYRSILVPLDGSAFGEQALPLALSIARRSGAELQLVHVNPPLAAIFTETPLYVDRELEREIQARHEAHVTEYLQGVSKTITDVAKIPVRLVVMQGEIAASLIKQATDGGADLVVMTTHARGPMGRFWLGSVTDELERKLSVPLLLTQPHDAKLDLSKDIVFRHILVPLDGSELSEQIIEPALALGELMTSEFTLLRVVKPVFPPSYPMEGSSFGQVAQAIVDQVQVAQEKMVADARAYLEKVGERFRAKSLKVQTHVIVEPKPALGILDALESPAIDCVALATHGRSGLARLFRGSVADKVIRGATVPVFVLRPEEK